MKTKREQQEEIDRARAEFVGETKKLPEALGLRDEQTRYHHIPGVNLLDWANKGSKLKKQKNSSPSGRKDYDGQHEKFVNRARWKKFQYLLRIKRLNEAKRKEKLETI